MYSLREYTDAVLDKAYAKIAGALLVQINAITNARSSQMQRALAQLDEEAARLAEENKRMTADNAVLQNSLVTYEQSLGTAQTLILANDNMIQETGQEVAKSAILARVFLSVSSAIAAENKNPVASTAPYKEVAKRVGFIIPDGVAFAQNYVDSMAWISKMDKWGAGYAEVTRKTILSGLQNGWSPIYTARQIRKSAENIPVWASENLTRTLQLTSYRDASAAMETVNNKFVEGKIRVAKLDDKTCLSCIALHGTPLGVGERVDDHYRGRCDVFYIVPGGAKQPAMMQADSLPGKRNFVKYQTGVDWFSSLPPARQAQQASFLKSPAKLRAFQDGVSLSEFIGDHTDDVFGHQFVEQSLVGAIGDDAGGYYTMNQKGQE